MILKVALLQMTACGNDQEANMKKGEAFCREAKSMGADIALFPEMWNIGYMPPYEEALDDTFNPDKQHLWREWQAQAVETSGHFVGHYRALARELNMAIAITYLQKWSGAPRNTVSIIDRHGDIALTYAKVHTCDFSMEAFCTPGDSFNVCELDTETGVVKIGAMICYDREFPESARVLMLKGAEIILTPNACGMEQHRIAQFKTRAYENMVGVALTNYAAPHCNGHSIAFDPIGFYKGKSRNTLVVEAGESEGIQIAKFDMDSIRAYRETQTWGNAFRKPRAYSSLVSKKVEYPFKRERAR